MIDHPYERDFKSMVSINIIQNCSITASDFTNVQTMFGPNIARTRGNTVRQNPDIMVIYYISVPSYFLKIHKFVTIVADVMFVNGASLLITISRGIKFVISEHIPTRMAKKLSKSLNLVMKIYSRSGMIL